MTDRIGTCECGGPLVTDECHDAPVPHCAKCGCIGKRQKTWQERLALYLHWYLPLQYLKWVVCGHIWHVLRPMSQNSVNAWMWCPWCEGPAHNHQKERRYISTLCHKGE